jgi:hypothetical protein
MKTPKTIIGKVIAAVLDLFKSNYPQFVAKLWNKIPTDLHNNLILIINVVEEINTCINLPITDMITKLIPGTLDDNAVSWLRILLPKILENYHGIEKLAGSDKRDIAIQLVKELTGSTTGQAVITAQVAYEKVLGGVK